MRTNKKLAVERLERREVFSVAAGAAPISELGVENPVANHEQTGFRSNLSDLQNAENVRFFFGSDGGMADTADSVFSDLQNAENVRSFFGSDAGMADTADSVFSDLQNAENVRFFFGSDGGMADTTD